MWAHVAALAAMRCRTRAAAIAAAGQWPAGRVSHASSRYDAGSDVLLSEELLMHAAATAAAGIGSQAMSNALAAVQAVFI